MITDDCVESPFFEKRNRKGGVTSFMRHYGVLRKLMAKRRGSLINYRAFMTKLETS